METDSRDTAHGHWIDELPTQVMITDAFYRRMIANPDKKIPFVLVEA